MHDGKVAADVTAKNEFCNMYLRKLWKFGKVKEVLSSIALCIRKSVEFARNQTYGWSLCEKLSSSKDTLLDNPQEALTTHNQTSCAKNFDELNVEMDTASKHFV
jgi:hypothetical protein